MDGRAGDQQLISLTELEVSDPTWDQNFSGSDSLTCAGKITGFLSPTFTTQINEWNWNSGLPLEC